MQVAPRVFVVDDQVPVQEALGELLAMVGFAVVGTARSETQATDWLYRHRGGWDLAIVDLMIEGGSGFNLIPRCLREPDAGRVLVVSDYVTPTIRDKCIAFGADDAFTKADTQALMRYLENFPPKAPAA